MQPVTDSRSPAAECSSCRAPLPDVRFARDVACTYCKATQPNPRVLVPDQEVLVREGFGYELGRVRSCSGPGAIVVARGEKESAFTLDELIPVTRASGLSTASEVFVKDFTAWRPAVVTNVSGNTIKVKSDAFDDAFFDQAVDVASVRVRADQPLAKPSLWRRTFGLRRPNWLFVGGVVVFIGLPALRYVVAISVELLR